MIIQERYIDEDYKLIKDIINETSYRYNNFSHFLIKKTDDFGYILYLYFSEDQIVNEKEKIAVDFIENVFYADIDKIIKYSSEDFDTYIKYDIFKDKENTYKSDVLLTYRTKKFKGNVNLSVIKYSCGGGTDSCWYKEFEILEYKGKDYYNSFLGDKKADWKLTIVYKQNSLSIVKRYFRNVDERLFELIIDDKDNSKINITRFEAEDNGMYGSAVRNVEYRKISIDQCSDFISEFISLFEDNQQINLSRSSIEYFRESIMSHISRMARYKG